MSDNLLQKKKVGDVWVFDVPDSICETMFKEADEVSGNTYPKPGKAVSAVLASSGKIFPGASYYSDTYTITMHAEMVALAHAALHGEKEIVAITGPNCHLCKQLLWESSCRSGIDIMVIFKEEDGTYKKVRLSTMMAYPWPDKKLDWAK